VTLAIRGDRTSCLSMQLGPATWLLAVARGFGRIGPLPTEQALLARLRGECDGRMRRPGFRRAIERPQSAATAMMALLARVNGSLHAATASHEDYVTAAASLTAVVVVQRLAYVMHVGSTGAYLVRDRDVTPLCADEAMEDEGITALPQAFAAAPSLDLSVSNVRLAAGDAIVLVGRRIAGEEGRHAVLDRAEAREPGEQSLVARFEEDAVAPLAHRAHRAQIFWLVVRSLVALLAAAAAVAFAH